MKNIIGLAVLLVLFFSSCGSDGGSSSIEGEWEVTNLQSAGCDDPLDNLIFDLSDDNCFEEDGFTFCMEIVYDFKPGGIMIGTSSITFAGMTSSEVEEYTYTIDGGLLTVCDEDDECSSATYNLSGDLLTFTYTDEADCDVTASARRK